MGKKLTLLTASRALVIVLLGVTLGFGELAIRSIHLLRDGIPFFETQAGGRVGSITFDQEVGWKAPEHDREMLVQKTRSGQLYPVRRSQTQYGFRQFGDLNSNQIKLIVIGDSFHLPTQPTSPAVRAYPTTSIGSRSNNTTHAATR